VPGSVFLWVYLRFRFGSSVVNILLFACGHRHSWILCVWSLANVYFVAESHETVLCLTFTNGKSFCTSSIPETEQGKPWLLKKQTKTHFRSPKICSPRTAPRIPGLGKHPKPTYSVVNWDQFLFFFFMDDLSFFHSFSTPLTFPLQTPSPSPLLSSLVLMPLYCDYKYEFLKP